VLERDRGWRSSSARRRVNAQVNTSPFEAGRDVAQVAAWPGHSDPGFTLRTYVHLMDDGVGDAGFLDEAVGEACRAATA
jgi:hypothetical protein